MADRKYKINFEMTDGSVQSVEFTVWTEADKAEIVQQVIAALGTPVFGRVDAENNIILTGELVDGTYTLKYEDADGNLTVIGTLAHDADAPNYTNQIPISTDTDGSIYNGTGYKTATRGNSSGVPVDIPNPNAENPPFFTGFIPCKQGDVIRLKNCYIHAFGDSGESALGVLYGGEGSFGLRCGLYNAAKTKIAVESWGNLSGASSAQNIFTNYTLVDETGSAVTGNAGRIYEFTIAYAGTAYIRLTLAADRDNGYTPADAIVTVNEEIVDITYTNQIPISTDTDGTIFNGVGYQTATRISSSGGAPASITNPNVATPSFTTGFIPVKQGDVIRLKDCWMDTANLEDSKSPYGHRTWGLLIAFYDAMDTTIKDALSWTELPTSTNVIPTIDNDGYVRQFVVNVDRPYMRLNLAATDPAQAILTVNEEIV